MSEFTVWFHEMFTCPKCGEEFEEEFETEVEVDASDFASDRD